MNFYDAFQLLMEFEGHSFTDYKDDRGGKTKWGITEAVARAHGFEGNMEDLTLGTAMVIAQKSYWDAVKANELPEPIRYSVFDGAFNSGVAQSVKWLQRAAKVKADGHLGPQTMAAVHKHDPFILKSRICAQRLIFLTELQNFNVFGRGWVNRVGKILEL